VIHSVICLLPPSLPLGYGRDLANGMGMAVMGHWYASTGVVLCGAAIVVGACRAAARGWRRSRDERARREVLARLAAAMRAAAQRRV
jgi:hypothetical protein